MNTSESSVLRFWTDCSIIQQHVWLSTGETASTHAYGFVVVMDVEDLNIVYVILCRELPSLAKNYVMRMLFLEQPLPQAAVALWVKKDSQK